MTAVEATGTEPDAVFIPQQDFDARTGAVGEDEGRAIAPVGVEGVGDILREGVDAAAHVDGGDGDEEAVRREHGAGPVIQREASPGNRRAEYRREGEVQRGQCA